MFINLPWLSSPSHTHARTGAHRHIVSGSDDCIRVGGGISNSHRVDNARCTRNSSAARLQWGEPSRNRGQHQFYYYCTATSRKSPVWKRRLRRERSSSRPARVLCTVPASLMRYAPFLGSGNTNDSEKRQPGRRADSLTSLIKVTSSRNVASGLDTQDTGDGQRSCSHHAHNHTNHV